MTRLFAFILESKLRTMVEDASLGNFCEFSVTPFENGLQIHIKGIDFPLFVSMVSSSVFFAGLKEIFRNVFAASLDKIKSVTLEQDDLELFSEAKANLLADFWEMISTIEHEAMGNYVCFLVS